MSIFEKSQGAAIELDIAAEWTANYRKQQVNKDSTTPVIQAHFFGTDILQQILNQEGCAGISIYYALDNEGEQKLILVGTSEDGQSMEDGIVADFARPCPPNCVTGALLTGLN